MQDISGDSNLPLGEAIIYGRLTDGTYSIVKVAKNVRSFYDPTYPYPIQVCKMQGEGSNVILWLQIANGLSEQNLVSILKKYRLKEADEYNMGTISAEDSSALWDCLNRYYDRYVETQQLNS